MDREPTNQEVADVIGIEVAQVEQYRGPALQLGDGSWLVHFSFDMPRELRHSFTGSFTAIVADPLDASDDRAPG